MKHIPYITTNITIAALISLTLSSCDTPLHPSDLVGQWKQTHIASQIDDGEAEISNETAIWTFNADDTYNINDGEGSEDGRWLLTSDSILVILTEGIDSLRTSYKILRCEDDTLIQQSTTQSDYGLITETTILTKTK